MSDKRDRRRDAPTSEPMLRGEGCLVFRRGGALGVLPRNRQDFNNPDPGQMEALTAPDPDHCVVHGKVSAFPRSAARQGREQPGEGGVAAA